MSVQKSSVRDITFSTPGDDRASVQIPAQLLEQQPKDCMLDYINCY